MIVKGHQVAKTNCIIPAHCQARNKALRHPDKQLKVDNIRSKESDGPPDPRLIERRGDKTSAEGDADLLRGGETSEAGLWGVNTAEKTLTTGRAVEQEKLSQEAGQAARCLTDHRNRIRRRTANPQNRLAGVVDPTGTHLSSQVLRREVGRERTRKADVYDGEGRQDRKRGCGI